MLPVAVAQSSSDGNAICYVLGFVDNVMFSRNGANGPKSDDAYVSCSSPGGGTDRTSTLFDPVRKSGSTPGTKSAVSDCILLHL